jgi:hypothetical protein
MLYFLPYEFIFLVAKQLKKLVMSVPPCVCASRPVFFTIEDYLDFFEYIQQTKKPIKKKTNQKKNQPKQNHPTQNQQNQN